MPYLLNTYIACMHIVASNEVWRFDVICFVNITNHPTQRLTKQSLVNNYLFPKLNKEALNDMRKRL